MVIHDQGSPHSRCAHTHLTDDRHTLCIATIICVVAWAAGVTCVQCGSWFQETPKIRVWKGETASLSHVSIRKILNMPLEEKTDWYVAIGLDKWKAIKEEAQRQRDKKRSWKDAGWKEWDEDEWYHEESLKKWSQEKKNEEVHEEMSQKTNQFVAALVKALVK